MALLTTSHTNNIASLYLSSLLSWVQLPTLLALNSERLTESYRLLAGALQEWKVDFIPATDGIFLFAKLARRARTVDDEVEFYDRLALRGVLVGPGRFYKGVETDFGWARIRFSISIDVMKTALERISTFLSDYA